MSLRICLALTLVAAPSVRLAGQQRPSPAPEARAAEAVPAPPVLGLDGEPDTRPDAAFVEDVRTHCSPCHAPGPPQYVPRGAWRTRIQEMALWSAAGTGLPAGDKTDLWRLDLGPFIRYFEARAPENLPLPERWPAGGQGLPLAPQAWSVPGAQRAPVVSNVRLFDLDGDGKQEIVACDMRQGLVLLGRPSARAGELTTIATLVSPAHAERVDLDRDGRQDLLVADLGAFLPGDHKKGAVVWLRQTAPLRFEPAPLVTNIPRTADVQAADFDGDGDLDLIAAVFGFRTVGGIYLYENRTTDWTQPRFETRLLDPRPGAIHVPVVDLDRDGRPDFVALVSQHYEEVVAFLNRGGLGFHRETIFRAPTPVWGSSGIQLVDLDGDGDVDLLMTNGDSLDDFTIRPFHGIRWYENQGRYPWKEHELALMPGAHRAQAADLDGDGDLDIVAGAFLPNAEHPAAVKLGRQGDLAALTSLGWLEQTKTGVFEPRTLERGRFIHATLDLGDFDGDGDVDMVTGSFVGSGFIQREAGDAEEPVLELWVNGAATAAPAPAASAPGSRER